MAVAEIGGSIIVGISMPINGRKCARARYGEVLNASSNKAVMRVCTGYDSYFANAQVASFIDI